MTPADVLKPDIVAPGEQIWAGAQPAYWIHTRKWFDISPAAMKRLGDGMAIASLDSSIPNIFNYSEISEPIQPNSWYDSVRKALVYSSHRLKLEDEIGATASRFPVIYLTDHPISRTLHARIIFAHGKQEITRQSALIMQCDCMHNITYLNLVCCPNVHLSFVKTLHKCKCHACAPFFPSPVFLSLSFSALRSKTSNRKGKKRTGGPLLPCSGCQLPSGLVTRTIELSPPPPSGGRKTGFGLRRFLKNRSETFTYSFGSCKAFTVRYFLPLSLLLLRNPTGLTRIPSPGANSRRSAGFRSIGDQISLSRRGKPRCLCFLRRKTTTFRRFLRVPFSGSLDRSIVLFFCFGFICGMQTMEAGLCSARTPSSQEESGDEELSVLPRHTKVIVTGNNRTKSVLVGLQGVVKKAVGLGGWHWLVLKNGVEVKLQRNALSVLEAPTGNEDDDDDIDCDNSFCSSSDMGDKDVDYSSLEFHKPTKPRVRHTRPWTSSAKSNGRGNHRDTHTNGHKPQMRLNLAKLGTPALWRYWRHFNLVNINPNPTKEQLIHGVQNHLLSQQLDEMQVIVGFIHTAKRLKTLYS
ncbi:unnamed protein product [Musa hybrid cultivar]